LNTRTKQNIKFLNPKFLISFLRSNRSGVVAFVLFFILGFSSINQSSLNTITTDGNFQKIQTYSESGLSIGPHRFIRSDEFLRFAPYQIAVARTGADDFQTPFSIASGLTLNNPSKTIDIFLNPERWLPLHLNLPVSVAFSLLWWTPFLMLFLGVIFFLRTIGKPTKYAIPFFILLAFAPSAAWWSFSLVPIIGKVLWGLAFLVKRDESTVKSKLSMILSGYFLAGSATYYQPWVLVLLTVSFPMVFSYLAATRNTVYALVRSGISLVIALIFYGTYFFFNYSNFQILQETVYPGMRRTTGGGVSVWHLFSSPFLIVNQFPVEILNTNLSEITTGLLIVGLIVALFSAIVLVTRGGTSPNLVATAVGGLFLLFWICWATINFGKFGESLFLVNRVPGFRVAGIIGTCAVLIMLFSDLKSFDTADTKLKSFIAIFTFLVCFQSGILLKNMHIPSLSSWIILPISISISVFVFIYFSSKWNFLSTVMLAVMTLSSTILVNPINFSVGEYDGSIVKRIVFEEKKSSGYWAADSLYTSALLLSTGVKSLSGQQFTGPNSTYWEKLDRDGIFKEQWNRGGSYLFFRWGNKNEFTISNPNKDIILISDDPCSSRMASLGLKYFIQTEGQPIHNCADLIYSFKYAGVPTALFKIRP
jgi:hypothetical protein